jgi:hypothetical protein
MNRARVIRLIRSGEMTAAGLDKVRHHLIDEVPFVVPRYVLQALRENGDAWKNFQRFPESYKRIRIGWIVNSRVSDRDRRLAYFVKMTAKNRRYGMIQ